MPRQASARKRPPTRSWLARPRTAFVQKCLKTDAAADKAAQREKAAADVKLAGAAKNSFYPEVRENRLSR